MANVFFSLVKAMMKGDDSYIEIPNFHTPQIKYIFELPFEFRIAVAFIGSWISFIAFDHITDIMEKKYLWIIVFLFLITMLWFLKQWIGIGPSSEDIIALFDEGREGEREVLSKNWKPINSNEIIRYACGKLVVIQWVSKQFGNLYLTDEKKPYFTFVKKIEQASKFLLIGIPSESSVDTVAFFSQTRRLYITNTILGYMKTEANRINSWEQFQLDFAEQNGHISDIFHIKSISRGRNIMHIRDGNNHKGFHDKYGEVAFFKMFYFDPEISRSDNQARKIQNSNSMEVSMNKLEHFRKKIEIPFEWNIMTAGEKIPSSCPVIIYLHNEGYLTSDSFGNLSLSNLIIEATSFQICQFSRDQSVAFFSRAHQRYLSLSGILVSRLRIHGSKFNNWEKFEIHYKKNCTFKCYFKVLKTWPPPTILKSHLNPEKEKLKAYFTLMYNETKRL